MKMIKMDDIRTMLESNRNFKENIIIITEEFIKLRNDFLSKFPDISLDSQQTDNITKRFETINEELIKQYQINQQPPLIICGPNSSGKTAFIQHFLQIGEIFPSDVGPVTTRIVKLTYASSNNAYAHIFSSLEDRLNQNEPLKSIQLDEYFLNEKCPEWEIISEILKEHLMRPDIQDEDELGQWAKCFIEIGLPSPILELGIDIYDTPGFLSNNRDEILNKNFHELIKSIQPTLLFLYENSSISETDKFAFLSLKQALGSLENIPIFFLNTKADVTSILKNEGINTKREISLDKFEKVLLETREKRYKLLLNHDVVANEIIGGLPDSVEKCDCFDICAVVKALTTHKKESNIMNERTFTRIIQFAIRSDANSYQILADKILSSIDEYFDLVLSTTYRTQEEWKELYDQALVWAERFFQKIESTLPIIVNIIHQNILKLFDQQKESIAIRAGNFIRNEDRLGIKLPPTTKKVRDFVRIAVYEEIMKVAANEALYAALNNIDKIVNDDLLKKKKKNEILSMAKRHIQFWEITGEDLNRKKFFTAILRHLIKTPSRIGRFFTSIRTRLYLDWYNQQANQYELLDALDNYASLFNESKRQEYARELLIKIRQSLSEQKPIFENNLLQWIETKQIQFISRITQGYEYAIGSMQERKDAHQLTSEYSEKFAVFQCQLIAAKDLAKFNGIKPTIFHDELLGQGGFFSVHPAEWADKQNLAVKKQHISSLINHPSISFMEAHYHRAITNVHQNNIVPLLYLFYENNQLYIFMPKYKRSLQNYLQENITTITTEKILSFALIIANVLNDIHQNDLVHRDIKTSNILLDHDDQCYLSDFGTVKPWSWNETFLGTLPLPQEMIANGLFKQFNLSTIYNGKAIDIFAYGILLYELLRKKEYHRPTMDSAYHPETLFQNDRIYPLSNRIQDYKQLIFDCLLTDSTARPDASIIISRIETLIQQNETRVCAICLDHERTVRTLPCRHKVLCQACRDDLRNRNNSLCIICKKLMQIDIQDGLDQTFYLKQ